MNREITVNYSRALIKAAVLRQWSNLVGRSGFILVIILLLVLLYFAVTGDRSWLFGLSIAGFVIFAGSVIFSYFRLLKMSLGKYERMEKPFATFRFTEEGVSIQADTGKTELAWKFVNRVLQYPELWLLVVAGSGGYITVPTESLDTELKEFILKKASPIADKAQEPPAHL